MNRKILGLDLGTNSIGLTLRNVDNGTDILKQIEFFTVSVFKSGVGKEKSGEFSYAARRTEKRSSRRLYQARKYRIWETLKLLIENELCPLSLEDLQKWSRYDKSKGLKRQYPIYAERFEQWVRLDFNGDGVADYTSPFQIRAELMEKQFDFSNQVDRYKLGRALYHIAQRRGFKSSKDETIKEQEKTVSESNIETDLSSALKRSEEKKSGKLTEYMEQYSLPTVGCAFYHLERNGIRVRNSEYQAVRSLYKDELRQIFEFQKGLDKNGEFYKRLVSEKKGEGTIFYKRPLRSQKGLIGNCTLEPNKPRCPVSHPEFEKFRAWCLINNIKFGDGLKEKLSVEQKKQLFKDKFLLTRSSFKFQEIREWIQKKTGKTLDYNSRTINYKDKSSISGCPISGRLKNLLGEDWDNWIYKSEETKTNKKDGVVRHIAYDAIDLWHVCFSFDDPEYVEEFARTKLHFDDGQTKQLVRIFGTIQQGYGMLSLKAIKNINYFLQKGLVYTDAVLLAKLPDIFKDKWDVAEDMIIPELDKIINNNRSQKQLLIVVNNLIANYKSLEISEQFALKNYDYKLDSSDLRDVRETTVRAIGVTSWARKDVSEQNRIIKEVASLYQGFFASEKRDYYKLPKVVDALTEFLCAKFDFLSEKDLRKMYHPSMIEYYAPAKYKQVEDGRILKLLETPAIGSLKNPMAMRVLHVLRKQINAMLKTTDEYGNALIDEDTRVVVETAKELNDANMRWAIEEYQREREKENKEYEKLIKEFYPNRLFNKNDVDVVRLACDQHDVSDNVDILTKSAKETKRTEGAPVYKKDITKYRLWLEQGCRCLYTGKIINISNLFRENAFDVEHTIPRSQSFDDSLENLSICDAHYNRTVKKNQIPTQLANYEKTANGYTAILPRLQPWFDKVEQLKDNVEFWKSQSIRAQDKDRKNYCVRQKHLWQMELDYWQNKVSRFTMTEVTSGFRNNQLNDTRIITKYAYHFLKTVFNKVEVQKGSVTANFRKMLNVQSVDEKKNRDKHSHHAVDATVLTLIPTAAQRDRMLELFYKIQEKRRFNECTIELEMELAKEKKGCGLSGNVSEIVPFIENNILVNHLSKDQTLTPAKRKARVRGKEVLIRNKQGELVNKWITGDSVRGQLHKESFFGAIRYPKTDENGMPIIVDGGFGYEKDKEGNDVICMVMRVPIDSFTKEEELKKIVDPGVRNSILTVIRERLSEGMAFKDAIKEPMWLLDITGNQIKHDKKGHLLSPIRHVRCKVAAGRGYFTKDKAIEVKKQTYPSKYCYKNWYYAQNDGNYLCLLYEGVKKGKVERRFKFLNYFDVVSLGIHNVDALRAEPYFQVIDDNNAKLNLTAIIKTGTRVLMWSHGPEELIGLNDQELSGRLFVVYKFNLKGANCIYLQNHIEARNEISSGEDYTSFDNTKYQARLTMVANSFNCLIENRDFVITEVGKIKIL